MPTLTADAAPKILHFHQFKNGGSTLDWILERNFGESLISHHADHSNGRLVEADILAMIQAHPETQAFTSHHFRLPLQATAGLLPLWLVRHPLDRIPSIYEQERRTLAQGPDDPRYASLEAWLAQALETRPFMICDSQVQFFAQGGIAFEAPTEVSLREAIKVLDASPYSGVVSDYDKSMVMLEVLMQRWWPNFDAAYLPQNLSQRDPTIEQRLESLREVISPDLFQQLLVQNRYDLALFEYARQLLARRAQRVVGFDQRLSDFRERCNALR